MPEDVNPRQPTAAVSCGSQPSLSKVGVRARASEEHVAASEDLDIPPGSALDLAQLRLVRVTTSMAESHAPVTTALLNQRGAVQGGVFSVVADATAGWATEAFLGNDAYTTTAITSALLGGAEEGDLLVTRARVVHGGRRTVVVSAEVHRRRPGSDERLIAVVTCHQLVVHAS